MPYEFYKILHLVGIVLLFSGLVSLFIMKMTLKEVNGVYRKFAFLTHGIGLFLLLLSGFGLLARLGIIQGWPGWVTVKLVVWVLFGGLIAAVNRLPKFGWYLYGLILLIFTFAAYLGVTKPF